MQMGDLNGDCVVDITDLLLVIGCFGSSCNNANCSPDNLTDIADLLWLLSLWGNECQ